MLNQSKASPSLVTSHLHGAHGSRSSSQASRNPFRCRSRPSKVTLNLLNHTSSQWGGDPKSLDRDLRLLGSRLNSQTPLNSS
jgi:hypothetical protein